jgi:hypothetical protein
MKLKPTPQLRFVERIRYDRSGAPGYYLEKGETVAGIKMRVLQQWWEEAVPTANIGFGEIQLKQPTGEWRDVPLEKEA